MRKKLLAILVCLLLVCSAGTVLSVNAGVNTNSPVGAGLVQNGGINTESFAVVGDETNAINLQKGNSTFNIVNAGWREFQFMDTLGVPHAEVPEGTVVTVQFDVYSYQNVSIQLYMSPASRWLGDSYQNVYFNNGNLTGKFIGLPDGAEIWNFVAGELVKAETAITDTVTGLGSHTVNAIKAQGNDHATFWLEYDYSALSLSIYAGVAEKNQKELKTVIYNDFALLGTHFNYAFDGSIEIDNYKVYTSKNNELVKSYADVDFETDDLAAKGFTVIAGGTKGSIKTYDTLLNFVNPAEGARVATLNKLKVVDNYDPTLELNASYRLIELGSAKVGILFGLNYNDDPLMEGQSFLGFSMQEEKLYLGAYAVTNEGTLDAIKEEALDDITIGENSAYINLYIAGKTDGSIDVTVNGNEDNVINFEGIDLNGALALTHIGAGNVNYAVDPAIFNVTGYELSVNEVEETISATFDDNYLNSNKFTVQSKLAPENFVEKLETTKHDLAGMVVEDGKVGFYGTSTNTRLMFNKPFSDFVLQFDYISTPSLQRLQPGGASTNGMANRYSPFYILFGAENDCPELTSAYPLGIIEGNGTRYFWGAESLILHNEGRFLTNGIGGVEVLNAGRTLAEDEEPDENSILSYNNATNYNEDGTLCSTWTVPAENGKYTLYNKTTRLKLIVVNNMVALFGAPVNEDGTAGDYILFYSVQLADTYGYVGFGTDAPGWAELDNVAITPISTEKALELANDATIKPNTLSADLIADVAVEDMVTDREPTPLAKAEPVVDQDAKKVTWAAVEGAKSYTVRVTLNGEKKIEKEVTALELDLSELTAEGTYSIRVIAHAEDANLHLDCTSNEVTYTVGGATTDSSSDNGDQEPMDCSSCSSSVAGLGLIAPLAIAAAFAIKKRKED